MYTHRIRYLYFYKWEISCTSTYEILTLEQSEENVGLQSVLNYSWQTIRVQWSQERKSTERSTQFQIVKTNVILLTASKNESSKNRGVIKSETSCQRPLTENERSLLNFMHLKKWGEKKKPNKKTTTHGEFKKKKKEAQGEEIQPTSPPPGQFHSMCLVCHQQCAHCVKLYHTVWPVKDISLCQYVFLVCHQQCAHCVKPQHAAIYNGSTPVSEPDHVMRKINLF